MSWVWNPAPCANSNWFGYILNPKNICKTNWAAKNLFWSGRECCNRRSQNPAWFSLISLTPQNGQKSLLRPIWVPEVAFWGFRGLVCIEKWSWNFDSCTPFGGYQNCTSSAQIKILRYFSIQTSPQNPQKATSGPNSSTCVLVSLQWGSSWGNWFQAITFDCYSYSSDPGLKGRVLQIFFILS